MGYVFAAYLIIWLCLFGYLGWIALRLRGAGAELAAVEELVREHEGAGGRTPGRRRTPAVKRAGG